MQGHREIARIPEGKRKGEKYGESDRNGLIKKRRDKGKTVRIVNG